MKLLCFFLLFPFFAKSQTVNAIPPNGNEVFLNFIQKTITLPENVLEQRQNEDVIIEIHVSESGKLDSFDIVKDIDGKSAIELIKAVKSAGDWTPATKNGKAIATWVSFNYSIPSNLAFKLNKDIIPAEPELGMEKFKAKFLANFVYPDAAIKAGLKGDFVLKFDVKEDGSIASIKLVNNPGFDLETNAVRAFKKSGKWKPATQKNTPIRSSSQFEFTLSLKEFRHHI